MNFSKNDLMKKFIKLSLAMPDYKKTLKSLREGGDNRAILIGTPVHGNLGDHLIAIESLRFIEELGYKTVIEVPEFLYEIFGNKITIHSTDDIYIVGGGWLGDLYEDQLVAEDIMKRWRENRIIILPQTIFFSGTGSYSSVHRFKDILCDCRCVYLCLREKRSYDFCMENFGNEVKVRLLPDMALLRLGNLEERTIKNRSVVFSIRKDIESVEDYNENMLKTFLNKNGYNCIDNSTVINNKWVKIKDREKITENKIQEYASAEVVVTDRLHTMIFSLAAGTKCVAFDNRTKKISGVYDCWLKKMEGLKVFEGIDEFQCEELLDFADIPFAMDFRRNFDNFIEELKDDGNK